MARVEDSATTFVKVPGTSMPSIMEYIGDSTVIVTNEMITPRVSVLGEANSVLETKIVLNMFSCLGPMESELRLCEAEPCI